MRWLNHKKLLFSAFVLLLFCLFLPSCYPPIAFAKTYTITEAELTQLETNLQTLKSHNQERQKALTEQASLLNRQQSEIEKLQTEIKASKAANEETRKSLEKANKYLSELEQEQKNKLRVKTRQRNLWIAISAGLMYAWIRK